MSPERMKPDRCDDAAAQRLDEKLAASGGLATPVKRKGDVKATAAFPEAAFSLDVVTLSEIEVTAAESNDLRLILILAPDDAPLRSPASQKEIVEFEDALASRGLKASSRVEFGKSANGWTIALASSPSSWRQPSARCSAFYWAPGFMRDMAAAYD